MPQAEKQGINKTHRGTKGEDYAARLLLKKGYKLIDRNFRSKYGEIDIIAIDNDTLVFVEVKARWSKKYGSPEEAVTSKKLKRIKRAIDYYNLLKPKSIKKQRIDVISLEIDNGKVISEKVVKVV